MMIFQVDCKEAKSRELRVGGSVSSHRNASSPFQASVPLSLKCRSNNSDLFPKGVVSCSEPVAVK